MAHYIHHVPGRLRVKTPAVKRNETQARLARETLEGAEGITAIDVNVVTGSIVINYDHRVGDGGAILDLLRARGYITHLPSNKGISVLPYEAGIGQKVTDIVVSKLVETVLERSATALIAAII